MSEALVVDGEGWPQGIEVTPRRLVLEARARWEAAAENASRRRASAGDVRAAHLTWSIALMVEKLAELREREAEEARAKMEELFDRLRALEGEVLDPILQYQAGWHREDLRDDLPPDDDREISSTAAEVYGILSRTDASPCLWCGKPYGEHSDVPLAVTPRMPCGGEKAHFVDARYRETTP